MPIHADARIDTLLREWNVTDEREVIEGAKLFETFDELETFFAVATRLTGITDFSHRLYKVPHPRAGRCTYDLAEYLVGMYGLRPTLAQTGLPKEAAYVLFREQVDGRGRMYPHFAGLPRYAALPADYVHTFLDHARHRLMGSCTHVLPDLYHAGVPAEYAGTVPLSLGIIDPALNIVNPLVGYRARCVIRLYHENVPAEYARDAVPSDAEHLLNSRHTGILYRHGIPADYARAMANHGIVKTVSAYEAGLPIEYARQL